jgi:hypothetical protein
LVPIGSFCNKAFIFLSLARAKREKENETKAGNGSCLALQPQHFPALKLNAVLMLTAGNAGRSDAVGVRKALWDDKPGACTWIGIP